MAHFPHSALSHCVYVCHDWSLPVSFICWNAQVYFAYSVSQYPEAGYWLSVFIKKERKINIAMCCHFSFFIVTLTLTFLGVKTNKFLFWGIFKIQRSSLIPGRGRGGGIFFLQSYSWSLLKRDKTELTTLTCTVDVDCRTLTSTDSTARVQISEIMFEICDILF